MLTCHAQVSLIAPWGLELLAYCLLYECLPRDKAAAAELGLRRVSDSQQRLYGGSVDSDVAERSASGARSLTCRQRPRHCYGMTPAVMVHFGLTASSACAAAPRTATPLSAAPQVGASRSGASFHITITL